MVEPAEEDAMKALVDTYATRSLIELVANGRPNTAPMITHRLALDEFETAYGLFTRPAETATLKRCSQHLAYNTTPISPDFSSMVMAVDL
ncbi:hypothetical protein NWT09_27990 [Mycolicibacterium sp. jd]|uniref:hypothetical protein n=1 Tax=Mycobacteriaceae TaxID=1762 RepID=UPI0012FA85CD|nr:hypothetical protein [Mycolicibacterium vanbaalenii]UJL30630.1 hypothetical protein HZU38_09530 [Mycolicibacterium vanbaalenii]